ncbi:MAG: hypothetical protein BIFFINMI_00951 [Phycisphaerae bacterium]|nr:hypothetical protein [Phycisphaerae bacterium]
MAKSRPINNLVVVSDLHCGCRLGLHPSAPTPLDDGGHYSPSRLQKIVWSWWCEFWDRWVPEACHGEPFAVLVLGDILDGVHHGSTSQVSHNLEDQAEIAYRALSPIAERADGRFYMIRGTEAHVGPSGVEEERLAKRLGAVPDEDGRHARWEAWIELGRGLVHATHHIGTTGSQAYESTAVMRELAEAYTEAGRWRQRPPDVLVRGHRHRHIEVRVPTRLGYGIAFTCPAWQLKTPYCYRVPGARQSMPQIGGSVIRQGDSDLYTRHWVRSPERTKAVTL